MTSHNQGLIGKFVNSMPRRRILLHKHFRNRLNALQNPFFKSPTRKTLLHTPANRFPPLWPYPVMNSTVSHNLHITISQQKVDQHSIILSRVPHP